MNRKGPEILARIRNAVCAVLFVLCIPASSNLHAASVMLVVDNKSPQAVFASEDVEQALRTRGHGVKRADLARLDRVSDNVRIVLCPLSNAGATGEMKSHGVRRPGSLKGEGYSIRTVSKDGQTTCWVIGADAAGVMYGGLELAEVIRVDDLAGIEEVDHNPYMAMRGT